MYDISWSIIQIYLFQIYIMLFKYIQIISNVFRRANLRLYNIYFIFQFQSSQIYIIYTQLYKHLIYIQLFCKILLFLFLQNFKILTYNLESSVLFNTELCYIFLVHLLVAYTRFFILIYIHVDINIIYIHISTYIHMFIYLHICISTYIDASTYIYIYVSISTYIYIYLYISKLLINFF